MTLPRDVHEKALAELHPSCAPSLWEIWENTVAPIYDAAAAQVRADAWREGRDAAARWFRNNGYGTRDQIEDVSDRMRALTPPAEAGQSESTLEIPKFLRRVEAPQPKAQGMTKEALTERIENAFRLRGSYGPNPLHDMAEHAAMVALGLNSGPRPLPVFTAEDFATLSPEGAAYRVNTRLAEWAAQGGSSAQQPHGEHRSFSGEECREIAQNIAAHLNEIEVSEERAPVPPVDLEGMDAAYFQVFQKWRGGIGNLVKDLAAAGFRYDKAWEGK